MNLAFIGGGSLGLETLSFFIDSKKNDNFNIFIVDFKISNKLLFKKLYKKITFLTNINHLPKNNIKVCITIESPEKRILVYKFLKKKKIKFFSAIHKSAHISKTAKIGEGVIIAPKAVVSPFSKIKSNVFINTGAVIGHNTIINSHTVICPNAFVGGYSKVGSNCYVGPNAVISPNLSLGSNSKLSAASVLYKNTKRNVLAHGNPAKHTKIYK